MYGIFEVPVVSQPQHWTPSAKGPWNEAEHGTHPLGCAWHCSAAVWCCSATQQRALYGKHADLTAIANTLQSQQNTAIFSCTEKQLVCITVVTLPHVKVKLLTPNGLIHC